MTAPRATARVQFHKDFRFDDAIAVIPYFAALGVSHLYASPILTARRGSTHGYDMVDPTRVNAELGGEAGLQCLLDSLRAADIGLIVDIVPNHMGIGPENPWWQHVLEWGQDSPYARWFDIDWQPADETLQGKVMAPFLGKPYGEVLSAGEITLQFDPERGKFFVSYYAQRFPLAAADYARVLRTAAGGRLTAAIAAFEQEHSEADPGQLSQLSADHGFGCLRDCAQSTEGLAQIHAALAHFSADTAAGMEALHRLLERQHYRLAWWRCAADGINWRRFFEVTDLAGVRVEQSDVFEATHALIFRLYTEGLLDGLRLDHVDGLADPGAYCRKLRLRLQALASQRPTALAYAPAYLIAEKILATDEQLRSDWGLDGTTGYEFMDQVGALLHAPEGDATLAELWHRLSGETNDFPAEVRQARRQLLASNLSGEFEAAARALHAVARTDLRTRDFSLGAIRRVFIELLVVFPVYRTYADSNGRDEHDQLIIDLVLEQARQNVDRTEGQLLDVLARWLGGDAPHDAASARVRALHQRALTRFQQLTPPLAAKSVEDTAFYRYGRLLSRNEVGADPGQFSLSVAAFHAACSQRADNFPHTLLATATHDHKRGEDTRSRIAVISECADEWGQALQQWMTLNAGWRSDIPEEHGSPACLAPQAADEVMLYQMLVGAWPIGLAADDHDGIADFAARIERWQTKALREAKQVSDWVMPNEAYEAGCRKFLHAILRVQPDNPFLPQLVDWVHKLTPAGVVNSLTQTALRLSTPGVPDLYQGTEFWDFSLVDPDNRRPVDFSLRAQALHAALPVVELMQNWQNGWIKQALIQRSLQLRALAPLIFSDGDYLPLTIEGALASHAIAFARTDGTRALIVVATLQAYHLLHTDDVPRIPADSWQDTALLIPPGLGARWTNIYTGALSAGDDGRLYLRDLLSILPVAILDNGASSDAAT